MNKLFQSIAFRCLLALAGFQVIGCGQADDSALDQEDLGSVKEALTIPSGIGFNPSVEFATCNQATQNCYVPATKHLAVSSVVNVGSCSGSTWNNALIVARGRYNTNLAGAGFSAGAQTSGFDPVVTTRCVTSIAGGARLSVTAIGGVVCFANGCQYSNLRMDIAGDPIVKDCGANHYTTAQCNDYIATWWQAGLTHISGNGDYASSLAPASQSYQRLAAYVP